MPSMAERIRTVLFRSHVKNTGYIGSLRPIGSKARLSMRYHIGGFNHSP